VEPRGAVEHLRPVDCVRLHLGDRRPRAIVNDLRRALARAGLGVIDADAIAAAQNVVGSNPFGAQRANRRFTDVVCRQPRHVVAVEAELRQADRGVRLAAAEGGDELRRLQKALEPGRAQAQHEFTKRDDFGHIR
jgi:hypothetical protein